MSFLKQALLSLVVILVAVGVWYGFTQRSQPAGAAGQVTAAGGQGAGQGQGQARGPGGGAARPLVVTAPVSMQLIGDDLQSVGSAASFRAITIFSQVTGVIAEIPVKPGDKVARGQPILRLVDEDQKVALEKAKVALSDAQYAQDRAEQLNRTQNVTQVVLTTARSNFQRAQIDLRTAQLELDKRTLLAPFDGVVGLFSKNIGDFVTTQAAITTFDDVSRYLVTFDVQERFAERLKLGHPVTATAESLPGVTMKGAVTALDSRIDETARTYKVQATFEQGIENLKAGMSVKAMAVFDTQPRPTVPSLAVLWDRVGSYVWRVEGDVVKRVPVTIVARRTGSVVITGPVKENDQVVVEGIQRMREGIAVTRAGGGGGGGGQPAAGGQSGGEVGSGGTRQRG